MRNSVVIFLVFFWAVVLSGCQFKQPNKTQSTKKPNIIFIFADDQSYNTINRLGNKDVITPNLDKMVDNGVTFTHAFNMGAWNGAVCVASRTMLNCGRSVWKAHQFEQEGAVLSEMWAQRMKKMGYATYFSGKWHVKAPVSKLFDTVKHVRGGMPHDAWNHAKMAELFKQYYSGKIENYEDFMPKGYNRPQNRNDKSWSPTDTTIGGYWEGGRHWSEVLRDDAIDFIRTASRKDQPFFMYLAFNAPHDPRQSPQKYLDMYDIDNISLPPNYAPLYPEREYIGNGPSLRDAALAPFPRTEYAVRVHLREYYALITHLDEQIGRIMNALKESGELDNTYIIYTADHGLAVGNHGLFGKQNMYDHSVRAPFILIGPDLPAGKKIDTNIYIQDAMATALDLAGYPKDESIFFNSVMPLAKGQTNKSAYPAIYGAYTNLQRMILKDGYKLIVYPKVPKIKLFNLREDPYEMHDLAGQQKYQKKVKELFNELLKLQNELDDDLDLQTIFNF